MFKLLDYEKQTLDNIRKVEPFKHLKDKDLYWLYSNWSENTYSASWLHNGEKAFIKYVRKMRKMLR